MSPWSLPCPKSVVMQVTFLLLFFFNTEYCITLPPELRRSTEGKVRLCAVVSTTGLCALVCCAESDCAQWFAVWSPILCAIVCTEDFDSTQLFTVRSPTQPSGLQCRVRTLHSGLQCGVRLCAIVCTLQCGVRICAVVCSAESDSTQWFAVWSPTLRSGFFLPC